MVLVFASKCAQQLATVLSHVLRDAQAVSSLENAAVTKERHRVLVKQRRRPHERGRWDPRGKISGLLLELNLDDAPARIEDERARIAICAMHAAS